MLSGTSSRFVLISSAGTEVNAMFGTLPTMPYGILNLLHEICHSRLAPAY